MNADVYGPTRTFATWGHPDQWQWFALKVAPGKEFAAERILRDDGHDVFVPIKHVGKKKSLFARPRLPGYVFIGANGGLIEWPNVLRFRMIIDFVAFDGKPMVLPAEDMHWLIRRNESLTPVKRKTLSRRQREKLSEPKRIVTGPYQGQVVSALPTERDDVILCKFLDQHLAKRQAA